MRTDRQADMAKLTVASLNFVKAPPKKLKNMSSPDIHRTERHTVITVCIYHTLYGYTECPRRNGQNFGRVFLMLNYTDITQNTYIQSWTVTEIMVREV